MTDKILINEIFESIQGEGRYTGMPTLFIRVSKCTRKCSFCDTQYHNKVNQELTPFQLAQIIEKSKQTLITISGGEPTIYADLLIETINLVNRFIMVSIETNGDLLTPELAYKLLQSAVHVSCSPKDMKTYKKIVDLKNKSRLLLDIKVVTDLNLNKNMIKGADYLMPLTTFNKKNDMKIKQDVWNYCVKHNIKFSERMHIDVWGYKQRGI